LGIGFIAYRDLLEQLIICFALLSCFIYPVARIYEKGGAYNTEEEINNGGLQTLGNLGYSSVQCSLATFQIDKIPLQCPFGTISDIVFKDTGKGIGINEDSLEHLDYCKVHPRYGNKECSDLLDKDLIRDLFNERCRGNTQCMFPHEEIIAAMDQTDQALF
jgi:hypothetical protein